MGDESSVTRRVREQLAAQEELLRSSQFELNRHTASLSKMSLSIGADSPLSTSVSDRGRSRSRSPGSMKELDTTGSWGAQNASPVSFMSGSTTGGPRLSDGRRSPHITKLAREIDRHGMRVEDALLSKGMEYREKLERKRIDEMRRREAEVTGHPIIHSVPDATISSAEKRQRVEERLTELGKKSKQDRDAQSSARLKEEEEKKDPEATFRPDLSLSMKTVSINRSGPVEEVLLAWTDQHRKSIHDLQQKYEDERRRDERDTPEIDAKSRTLAQKQARARRVEEELLRKGQEIERKKRELAERIHREEVTGNPRITALAATLNRHGDVGERLYAMRKNMDARRLEAEDEWAREFTPFTPSVSSPRPRPRIGSVEDDILERARKSELEKKSKIERLLREEDQRHRPNINPTSAMIASRLPTSAQDRLYRSAAYVEELARSMDASWKDHYDSNLTFQPEINAVSRHLEKSRRGSPGDLDEVVGRSPRADRNVQLFEIAKRQQRNHEERKKEEEGRELAECTFKPRISKLPEHVALAASSVSVIKRAEQWARQRQERLHQEQQAIESEEMKECTFTPKITRGPLARTLQSPDSGSRGSIGGDSTTTVFSQPGFEEFIARQEAAKRLREEKENAFISGQNWSPSVTKPVAPKLGLSNRRSQARSSSPSSTRSPAVRPSPLDRKSEEQQLIQSLIRQTLRQPSEASPSESYSPLSTSSLNSSARDSPRDSFPEESSVIPALDMKKLMGRS